MKILLADDDAARDLAADPGLTLLRARPGEALADAAAAQHPDLVLMRLARPSDDALAAIRQIASGPRIPVVLFVAEDDPAFMEAAIAAGLTSYNVLSPGRFEKPDGPRTDKKPILRAAIALFRRQEQAQAQLAARATIERAKAVLIRERGFGEPDAYRWLRRQAMASRRRIADVAETLLRERDENAKKPD